MYEMREKEQNDYAEHGISSLHGVGRHLTDLVVKRLIMTARKSKAWRAFARSGSGGGESDKNEGPKSKRKRRAQTVLRAVIKKSGMTKPGELPRKRKATEDVGGRSRPSALSAALKPAPAVTPLPNVTHRNLRQTSMRGFRRSSRPRSGAPSQPHPRWGPRRLSTHLHQVNRLRHESRGGRE
jgi:hypothetical protein